MKCDILLVNPVFLSQNEAERELSSPYFPLGLLYLAAYLRQNGFQVEIFDGTFADGLTAFAEVLKIKKPTTVGITAVQPNRAMALEIARLAKQVGGQVILGGPDPTLTPESYLSERAVDFIVHHEGELTLIELLAYLLGRDRAPGELKEINGIAYRSQNDEIVYTPRRPYILDLDQLPLPARDLIDMDAYLNYWRANNGYASLTISVARGCPYGCRWCQDAVHGAELRQRSPENVAAEVKALMGNYQIDRLRVVDDVDGLDLEWLQAWARAAEKQDAVLPFEALNDLQRREIPMLDVRDSL